VQIELDNITTYTDLAGDYYICSASMLENYEVFDDWINSCVIATDSLLDQALNNRVLGAEKKIMEFVPELNAKSNKSLLFFKINANSSFIKKTDKFLMIYNDKNEKQSPSVVQGYKTV